MNENIEINREVIEDIIETFNNSEYCYDKYDVIDFVIICSLIYHGETNLKRLTENYNNFLTTIDKNLSNYREEEEILYEIASEFKILYLDKYQSEFRENMINDIIK